MHAVAREIPIPEIALAQRTDQKKASHVFDEVLAS